MAFRINTNRIETENKTIRFPILLIDIIENTIKDKDISFSRFVIQACEYALANMESENKPQKKQRKIKSLFFNP